MHASVPGDVLKKIEQEVSKQCHYSEYLTLLNTSQDGTTRD